ncbi:MAG: type I-U CRISPR-associated protein Cas5/Cas6 [Planctomycetes bacterium]|nr:type I-U CRISPR-associated protein Cas5/Cas6 [Planctomycetota bacterium]
MATLSIVFIAGRYHGTPWGLHVNEGGVDWPPAPWRLLRALLAVGFAKSDWDVVPEVARRLIIRLATVLPSYQLPIGGVAHTRHYMPSTGGKTTKVLDTFLRFFDNEPLLVSWPVVLPRDEAAVLGTLAGGLSYLGRAESWCSAAVVEDPATNVTWSRPCADGQPVPQGWDQLTLLAPIREGDYENFRRTQLARSGEVALSAKAKAKRAEAFPADLVACLLTDTATLRSHGWSQPPGSHLALYLRPSEALQPAVAAPRRSQRTSATVETVLLELSSDSVHGQLRPLLERCLPQMEILHDTAVGMLGPTAPGCPVLTGRDPISGAPLTGHQHTTWLPLDLDEDGHIDHVILHAPMGIDSTAQKAIARISRTWAKGLPDVMVNVVGNGDRSLLARQVRSRRDRPLAELAHANVWTSRTPFIAPRFLKRKGGNTLEGQVLAECAARKLPRPTVEVLARDVMMNFGFLRFVRHRRSGHPQPPNTTPWALRLTFAEPVTGPISLGYASHFGLGLFAAVS